MNSRRRRCCVSSQCRGSKVRLDVAAPTRRRRLPSRRRRPQPRSVRTLHRGRLFQGDRASSRHGPRRQLRRRPTRRPTAGQRSAVSDHSHHHHHHQRHKPCLDQDDHGLDFLYTIRPTQHRPTLTNPVIITTSRSEVRPSCRCAITQTKATAIISTLFCFYL